jgi:RimJ/RimL family protein N-acetyltransferase
MSTARGSDAPAFDLQPTLEGALLLLRPLEPADFEALFRAAGDPGIWEQHPESDRHERAVFQRYFDGAIASGGAFAVIERTSGRIIGSTRYCNLVPAESEVEIGWTFLERKYWGGVYNGEMKALMLDHAFRFVDRVVFVIGENNVRSRRAVERIGGTLFRHFEATRDGNAPGARVVYAITRPEWSARSATRSQARSSRPSGLRADSLA